MMIKSLLLLVLALQVLPAYAEDWITTNGKTLKDVKVLKVEADAVTILDSDGGGIVFLKDLPSDLRKRFSYDPAKAKIAEAARAKADAENASALQAEAGKVAERNRLSSQDEPPSDSLKEPSFAVYQSDVSGQAGVPGDNSPATMATDLGRYKAKVYRAVGARWYEKVNSQIQVLDKGTVRIKFRIYSDGHLVIESDPEGGESSLALLHSVSLNSMTEAAPFDPFSDKMKKEVGDSFADEFSFNVYQ
jgi:hypothetical protein